MRRATLLGILFASTTLAVPALAQDAMAPTGMMAMGNMASAMAPDGHIGSMAVTPDEASKMMAMSTPLSGCAMVMTDKDGKMFMVDTSSADAMTACNTLAMTPPAAPAANTMAPAPQPMAMMPANMVTAMMPDGHIGMMAATGDEAAKMMGMAKPVSGCMMTMTDKDGKMYMVDTSSADAMAECNKLSAMGMPM